MDRLNSPAYGPAQQQPRSTNQDTTEGRPSFDSQRLRLRKKRSYNNTGVRNASQPLPASPWPQNTNAREPGDNERARRGTLRNVVRRIFGRRSKEFDSQQPVHTSPPRHGYHRSEPPALSIPKPQNHPSSAGDGPFPHRTLSAPVHHVIPQPNLERQRSPYAVEFPHSARLKPLTLANPFTAPGSQLRRRKTLPSLLIPDNEAPSQTADDARGSPDRHRPPSEQTPTSPGRHGSGPHVTTTPRTSKRKSRSVGDLKFFQRGTEQQTSPRKKNEELRIWRDSIQAYKNDQVLRASGFTSAMLPPPTTEVDGRQIGEELGVDRATTPTAADPFPARTSSGGTATAAGDGNVGFMQHRQASRTGGLGSQEQEEVGTEGISLDLEDRVARLEAGLQHFQFSLRSLTNDRSPGPVIVSGQARTPSSRHAGLRGVDYARTPSMLADTLAADFYPSAHHHQQQQQPGSSVYEEDDDHLHRVPSSSPLNYYYHHRRSSTHDPLQRPETPQTPPLLRGSALSSHYRGNASGARPSMPPFPRRASTTTMTEDEHNEDEDEEVNFPFPAQSASFSASAEAVGSGGAVDSPGELLPGGHGTSSRKRRKGSGGFHFPFPPSFPLREPREVEVEDQRKGERQLQVLQGQQHQQQEAEQRQLPLRQFQHHQDQRDRRSELRPPIPSPNPPHEQHHHPQHQPHPQQNHPHTFQSLYEMLADERSARRDLEVQLRGLRQEIRDLHWQVSSSESAAHSPASLDLALKRPAWDRETMRSRSGRGERGIGRSGGGIVAGSQEGGAGDDEGAGSSSASQFRGFPPQRLRTTFTSSDGSGAGRNGGAPQPQPQSEGVSRDTVYLSDPSYHHHHHLHYAGNGKSVISRFSGSESEAGGGVAETSSMGRYYGREQQRQQGVEDTDDEDELMTPLEAYQTPLEEAGRFGFRGEGGVF
ncbi:hypothetical protein KC338_g8355 [Hortaea werneckii]|nr:hypothetical protein KC338_g8355 [Hortaea werneckii]